MNTGLYDRIVFEYLDKTENLLLVASEDPVFIKILRAAINKTVGVKRDSLYIVPDLPAVSKAIRDYTERKISTILLLERMQRERAPRLLVVASGDVVGVVTLTDLQTRLLLERTFNPRAA
jgi:hypothetical protein